MPNFALVGCGSMAHGHAQQLNKIGDVKIVALVDPLKHQTEEFKRKYANDAVEFDSFDRLLDHPPGKLDAVLLVTPHTAHFSQSKAALERGLHVLVEKPMVTSSADALELSRTVQRTGKLLGIAFQAPYSAEYQCLARMRDTGQLGKITLINGWLAQNWLAFTKDTWRVDPKLSGGGQMYDSGAHVLNSIVWLVNSPVVEVACMFDRCGTPVDINGVAILKFENGTLASLAIGGSGSHWDATIHIQTDKLVAKTGPHGSWLEMNGRDGRKVYPQIEFDDHPAANSPQLNFVNAVLEKEPLRCGVRYGVLLSALMDALYESAEKHEIVKVAPVEA